MTRKMKKFKMQLFPEREFAAGDVSLTMYGEPGEFRILAEKWHEMVKAGVEALRISLPHANYWQSIGSNYTAFPIVYNYRHVLELYLKGILFAAEQALVLEGEQRLNAEVFRSHRFGKLRTEIECPFATLEIPYDFGIDGLRTINDFRSLLADLDQLEIRYPVDVAKNPAMGDRWVRFNLFEFAERMDAILEVLKGYAYWVEDEVDARCEMAYEEPDGYYGDDY